MSSDSFLLLITHHFMSAKRQDSIWKDNPEWLTVVYLPKRAPFLNPVESKVNRNLKKDICANYSYETEENLLCSVRKYLRRLGCWPKI